MTINLRRDAWKDERQYDDVRSMALEIDRLAKLCVPRIGTWTPGITFGGSAAGVTFGGRRGQYYKLGALIVLTGSFSLTNNGTGVGNAIIDGLPFTVKAVTTSTVGGLGHYMAYSNIGAALDELFLVPEINAKTARIQRIVAGATTLSSATDTDITNTFAVDFVMIYQTDDP